MAKTQQFAGTQLTSQPERLPLTGTIMSRNSSINKDQRFINCFQESIKNELTDSKKSYVVKRPGLTQSTQVKVGGGTARGFKYWSGNYYSVIGNTLYRNSTSIYTLATSTGPCGFEEFDNAGVAYLFLADGTNAYSITTVGVVTQVNTTYSIWGATTNYNLNDIVIPTISNGYYYKVTADAGSSGATQPTWPTTISATVVDSGITWTCAGTYGGFPTPHIPIPKFVDGYMILPAVDSLDFYNSDVDNIYGWGTGAFSSAEMWPDNIVGVARQNNQVVMFGSNSSEFFYDSGAAESPFARNEGTVLQIGCAAPYAVYENERFCIFIGQSQSGGRAVWLLEGFQPKKISTEGIERVLDAEGTSISSARGYGLRTKGHLFYIINITSTTLVYDVEEKVWHQWSTNNNGTHTVFQYNFQTDIGNGKSALLHNTNGYIYILDPAVYRDNGTDIICDIYTSKYDGSTQNRKFMHNLSLIGDKTVTDFQVRWSDDDYTTWSNWKTLESSRPIFARLGSFRRRALNIKILANEDIRLEAVEFEVDVGTH